MTLWCSCGLASSGFFNRHSTNIRQLQEIHTRCIGTEILHLICGVLICRQVGGVHC